MDKAEYAKKSKTKTEKKAKEKDLNWKID